MHGQTSVWQRGKRTGWAVQLIVPASPGSLAGLPGVGKRVEELGFDACFVFDHPLFHPDPWVALAALAVATDRIWLGTGVICVSYRNPMVLARLAADLQALSGGRFILGMGAGNDEDEFRLLGLPFPSASERLHRLAETVRVVREAWETGLISLPVPLPPLMIGGSGERLTLRLVAELADACNIREDQAAADGASDPRRADSVARKLQALDQHCREIGRAPEEILRTHMTLYLVLAPTGREAAAKLAGIDTARSTHPRTRRSGAHFIFGWTPERAVDYYRHIRAAGIDAFVVQLDASDDETIQLLAREVMPHVD